MILVDSSVWIDLFKNKRTPQVVFLENLQKSLSHEICISHIIYFEVLRGIPSDLERKRIQKLLNTLVFCDYHNQNFDNLTSNYRTCRQKGFTLLRLGDWVIFETGLDHSLELLPSDGYFHQLNKIYPFHILTNLVARQG